MPNYSLINQIAQLNDEEKEVLAQNPFSKKEDWTSNAYDGIKQRIKRDLILGQFDRCAYCRKIIEADGKYEPLEHIVAKSKKVAWMFEPKNLIVTCDSCNNLKGTERTLKEEFDENEIYPNASDAFLIFHPHYDTWSEHLNFDDEIFIVPIQNSKGSETIRICKLYRYNIILNRAKELKLDQKSQAKKTLHRLSRADIASQEYANLKENLILALDHFLDRMDNNPNFA